MNATSGTFIVVNRDREYDEAIPMAFELAPIAPLTTAPRKGLFGAIVWWIGFVRVIARAQGRSVLRVRYLRTMLEGIWMHVRSRLGAP